MDKDIITQSDRPTISVLLPVYNGERFLKEAIDSILNQTYSNFELIILDDCSTDNTANIINSYADNRIRYIRNEKNLKIAASLNKGISLAKGDYIARMDADDISLPDRFQKQYDLLEGNSNIDIVNIRYNIMSEDGKKIRKFRFNVSPTATALNYLINIDTFICHPGVMIRSDWYQKYKYNTNEEAYNIEDCELWIRMLSNGAKCFTIKEPLLNYRINSQSVTHTNLGSFKQIQNVCNLFQDTLEKRLNFNISISTLQIIKGYINDNNIKFTSNFIKELKLFEDRVKEYEKNVNVCNEIHHWAEYCKFRTIISIIKSNCNLWYRTKAIMSLLFNLRLSIFIVINEYKKLSKQ